MDIMSAWYEFWGRVWVPHALRHLKEPVILHLSDTPAPFFDALPGLIRDLKPTWIIHTGDLVDDVKLGLNPGHRSEYTSKVRRLIQILESSGADAVFMCLGNHDDIDAIGEVTHRIRIFSSGHQLTLGLMTLGVAHYAQDALAVGGDICVFGHNLDQRTDLSGSPRMLNGLESIHVILPLSGQVFMLPYPHGTNEKRLGMGKIGL